jgi:nicotinamide-nucleotide amidase
MNAPQAEILTIGTEILLGQIVDTNTAAIARSLRGIGVNLYFAATVGDNVDRSAAAIRTALERSDILITTGGLGPTIDDMTRAAMAGAVGVDTEFSPALWEQIKERFAHFGREPSENNRRQAYLPIGATGIENPVGTAPAFWLEYNGSIAFALPGVPAEMEHLLEHEVLPLIESRYSLAAPIHTRILRTAGIGESSLDSRIQDLETADNPTLGVSAHPGQVDLRLGARAESVERAQAMLSDLERELRDRLGDLIFGQNDETLAGVVLRLAAAHGWRVVSLEAGTGGTLAQVLAESSQSFDRAIVAHRLAPADLSARLAEEMAQADAQLGFGLVLLAEGDENRLTGVVRGPGVDRAFDRTYNGPPANAAAWGCSHLLNLARRPLSQA